MSFVVTIPLLAQNQSDLAIQKDIVEKDDVTTHRTLSKHPSRIKETGGEIIIDGSIRILEQNFTKVFDLVEVSTPATPATNHVKIWLRADAAKQSLMITFDDGTHTRITGN